MTKVKEKILPALKDAGLWCCSFLKKHVKVFYVAICLVLALLIISLVSTTIKYESEGVASYDDELPSLGYHAYSTSVDESGNVTYTPLNNDPQLYFDISGSAEFNTITIHLKNPINTTSVIQVYYSYAGEDLSEPCSVKARIQSDGKTVSLVLPKTTSYSLLRIDIDCQFTLDKITLETTTLIGMQRALKVGVAIALVVLLGILVGVEKWFGFYRYIWSLIKKCYDSTKALLAQRKYAKFVVRILLILACATLCVSYAVILMTITMSLKIIVYLFVLSAITIALFIADRILSGNVSTPIMFLVITIICGFMIASTLPIEVSNGADEEFHYAKCVEMKIFLFGNEETYADLWQAQRKFVLTTDRYLSNMDKFIFDLIDYDQTKYEGVVTKTHPLKYVGHIPGAFAMSCSDATGLNYFSMFIISKMANVLVYAFVIYLGIKKLKRGAFIVSSICLMPTAVFFAATYSYDYFVTAFSIYSFTYFLSMLQDKDKKLTVKDAVLMLGAFFLACGPKAVYFALLFPMLFMPKEKFTSKRARTIYICAVFAVALAILSTFLLPFLSSSGSGFTDDRGGSTVSSGSQLDFILGNPVKYAKILLRFLGEYVSFKNASNFVGYYMYVGSSAQIWASLSLCVVAFCTFVDKGEEDLFKNGIVVRIASIFASFVSLCFVATALYINFTPVGYHTVLGCQWRYIIPALFPFLYAVGSPRVRHTIDKRVINGIVFGALSLCIFATFYDVYISKIIPLI